MRAKSNVYHLECFACQQCNHRYCNCHHAFTIPTHLCACTYICTTTYVPVCIESVALSQNYGQGIVMLFNYTAASHRLATPFLIQLLMTPVSLADPQAFRTCGAPARKHTRYIVFYQDDDSKVRFDSVREPNTTALQDCYVTYLSFYRLLSLYSNQDMHR